MQVTRVKLKDIRAIFSMLQDTWEEVDQRKEFGFTFDPDWSLYERLEETDSLFLYTFEDKGFASFLVSPDLHRKGKLIAVSDVAYLKPEARGCFEECLVVIKEDLKSKGADYLSMIVKTREEDKLYGYKLYEKTYQGAL